MVCVFEDYRLAKSFTNSYEWLSPLMLRTVVVSQWEIGEPVEWTSGR